VAIGWSAGEQTRENVKGTHPSFASSELILSSPDHHPGALIGPRSIRVVFQTLLRQDDTNGGVAEAVAAEMRDMQSEDPAAEADSHPARRK